MREHGQKAIENVVSRIVVALKSRDETTVRRLGVLLNTVEALLDEQVSARRYGRKG